MPLILGANSVSGYTVKNSLRFNSGSSDELTRTFASDGNRKTFTFSCWVKKTNIGINQSIFFGDTAGTTNATQDSFYFHSSDAFYFGGWTSTIFSSTMLFRDVSAWYHIVVAVDTTQATSANRVKFYVNGVEQSYTSGAGYPAQNADFGITKSGNHSFFGNDGQSGRGNGYLAETYLIDGQQLTPSSFGETDEDTGIWKPKAYTGSFGTNGFYLKFANSASLGTDSSGNGNTFTVNNLTSIDQTTDTPTNNFATMNSIDINTAGTAPVFTEGNLTVAHLSGANGSHTVARSTIAVSKGKWYSEYKIINIGSGTDRIGVINANVSNYSTNSNPYLESYSASYAYLSNGNKGTANAQTAYGATYTTNDIIGVALDCDNGTVTFYKNGTTQGTAFTGLDTSLYYSFASTPYNNQTGSHNFGNPAYTGGSYTDGAGFGNFSYAVPSGYYALNTKNLANFG